MAVAEGRLGGAAQPRADRLDALLVGLAVRQTAGGQGVGDVEVAQRVAHELPVDHAAGARPRRGRCRSGQPELHVHEPPQRAEQPPGPWSMR